MAPIQLAGGTDALASSYQGLTLNLNLSFIEEAAPGTGLADERGRHDRGRVDVENTRLIRPDEVERERGDPG